MNGIENKSPQISAASARKLLGLDDFDLEEPAVLAARTAFPPTDHEEGYKELVDKIKRKSASKKLKALLAAPRFGSVGKPLPTRELVERMKNGLSNESLEARKRILVDEYGRNARDSGSTEVQVALITARIENLQKHLGQHRKDNHSKRGLLMLAAKRNRLLRYLKISSTPRYYELIKSIGIRDSI